MKPLDKTKKYYTGGLNKAQRKELLNWLKCNDRGWMWTTQSDLKNTFIEYKYIEFCDGWYLSEYVEGKTKRVLELFEEETYTESQLTSFGNYLLSEERKRRTSIKNRGHVTHSDMENWNESKKI